MIFINTWQHYYQYLQIEYSPKNDKKMFINNHGENKCVIIMIDGPPL